MKTIKRLLVAALLCVAPLAVSAQVTNGDFSSGTASWNWKTYTMAYVPYDACSNYLAAFTPSTSTDTPTSAFEPARGRYAKITSPGTLANGTFDICRSIDQTIYVPSGKNLSFEAKLGTALSSTYSGGVWPVEMWVSAVNVSTGVETQLLYATGQSVKCPVTSYCPQWITYNASLSAFWGQNIILKFRTRTQHTRSGTGQTTTTSSDAWADNITLQ